MNKPIFLTLLLSFGCVCLSQRQQNNGTITLRQSNVSFQDMLNGENNSFNYHVSVNEAIKHILDGNPLEGIATLKPALYSSRTTLAIDWFMASIAFAQLNEKQGFNLSIEEALAKDISMDSLMRNPLCTKLFGGFLGEKDWKEFTEKKRSLILTRIDAALIDKLMELEKLDQCLEEMERTYKDSILVYHKADKKIKENYQNRIAEQKVLRDKGYNGVIDTDAWPLNRIRRAGQTTDLIIYDSTPDWFEKNEQKLIALMHNEQILPWELAFIHDYHAKMHKILQKFALFHGQRLDERVIMNCDAIGMPWGDVRDVRMFYRLPETL